MNVSSIKRFLLQNRGVRQTIVKNTFWLAVAEIISHFLQFIIIIFTIRVLGSAQFGIFSFALAFVSTLAVFSNFGLASFTTRGFSQDRNSEKEYSSILSLKIILSIGILLVMFAGSFFISEDIAARRMIW